MMTFYFKFWKTDDLAVFILSQLKIKSTHFLMQRSLSLKVGLGPCFNVLLDVGKVVDQVIEVGQVLVRLQDVIAQLLLQPGQDHGSSNVSPSQLK